MASDSRIKVAIRVRTLNNKEKARNKSVQWKLSENKLWQIEARTEQKIGQVYTFDYVFGMSSQSKDIFEVLAKPIVESCLQGFNGTIFAYGQTSSGKTYTMMGENDEEGIIPMSIHHIFKVMESIPAREFLIRIAYMEIYNEQIHDLLELKNNNLKIHEDSSGQAYVTLKEEIADTPEKVIAVMKKGEKMRRFGVTDINERSSRSHTIFRIVIESRKKQMSESFDEFSWDDSVQISVLNLVDLAGSERVMQTKATGDRFKEGCAINKSLFYLGNVISQLSEGSGQYVNFRDSKLTRILRTSLGGNAHTAIICTITPASIEETISTLSFASRAICVKNEPHVNEIISNESLMRGHAAIVKKLEMELEKARREIDSSNMKRELEQKENIISRLKGWIQRDMVQVNSPRNNSRSQRRKTWAASDFKRMNSIMGLNNPNTIPEEPKGDICGLPMETDSQSRESVFFEDSFRALPGSSNVTCRRGGSVGQSFGESFDPQYQYSWYSPCSERFSSEFEGRAKRRRQEMEEESDEITDCRKSLQEAISQLHGNDIDLQSYSLLELINELVGLAGENKPVVLASDTVEEECHKALDVAEYEQKIAQLEDNLAQNSVETNKIILEKEELESLFASSIEKYRMLRVQLDEVLNNFGSTSEKITMYEQRIAELEENLTKNVLISSNLVLEKEEFESLFISGKDKYKVLETKSDETLANLERSQKKLDQAEFLNESILKLENELMLKESELESMHGKLVALATELSEERAIRAEEEQKVNAQQNLESNNQCQKIEELLAKVAAQESKIAELQENILEKEGFQTNISSIENVNEYEKMLEEERKKSESLMEQMLQLQHELTGLKRERDMLLTYQQDDDEPSKDIEDLKSSLEECKSKLLNVEMDRDALISNLASGKEENEYLLSQLTDAQSKVETLSKELTVLMLECETFKGKEAELLSLREELKQAQFSLEFCAQSEEELDNLLSVEKNKVRDLQNELNKLKEENEKLINSREGNQMALPEETKSLLISLEECKSELSNVMLERNDLTSGLDSIKSENVSLQNQLKNAQMDIESLLKKLADVESRYDSFKNSELESLKAELENGKLTVHVKTEEDLDNLLSIEKAMVNNLQKELSEVSTEKNDLFNEKIKLTESLEKIEQELASLVDEHIKCTENELKMIELEEALQEANETVANIRKEKELELENERKRSEKVISEKEECINALSEENKVISGVNEEKLSSLEKMLETEIAKCAEKTEEIQSVIVSKNKMEEMLKEEKDKVADLERKITIEEEKLLNLKVAVEEQAQEKERLRALEFDLQRRISHTSLNEKELESKNLELISSMEKIERQLKLLNQDHSTLLENNIKLTETNDELSSEVDLLQIKLSSSRSEVERLEASLNAKQELLSKMEKCTEEMSSSLVMSNRTVSKLEKDVDVMKDELYLKISEANDGAQKIAELQSSLEEAHDRIGVLVKEVYQLQEALQNSKEKLSGIDNEGNEMERNQTVNKVMEEQIAILKEERKTEIESYEEKIITLERLLSEESEKCTLKTSEVHVLKMNKNRLEKMLQAEKDRVSDLEKQMLNDEEKLVNIKEEIEGQRQENDRLKTMEIDLTSKLELERQKNIITENELDKLKSALSSSEINLNQLKCEVASLKKSLREETSKVAHLETMLEIQKKAYLDAKEAEGRVLSALSAQEKSMSVLSTKESSCMESKAESNTIEEKEKQIKELTEKLEDQEKYIKQFDKTIEKMDRKYNLTLDYRLEVERKAKATETELLSQISELKKKISQVPKIEEAKSNALDLEKEVQHAKLKIEETEKKLQAAISEAKKYHLQANDYKRETLHCKQLLHAGVARTECKVECGVQTVPVVEDLRPCGSGIVQYYKIDCLEKKVKDLEKEKEFLKKLCKRRHDQREELRAKLDALTGEKNVVSINKENESLNV